MNRLILTIMFAIALALSFMSFAHNDMSWNSNSQNSSTSDSENGSWVSRMAHLFGSYRPVMGKLTLAETASENITPCNGAADCEDQTTGSTRQIVRIDKANRTLNITDSCEKCNLTKNYSMPLPQSITNLELSGQEIMALVNQNKADFTAEALNSKLAGNDDRQKSESERKKESKAKREHQRKVDLCEVSDEKDEDGKYEKIDKADLSDCLMNNYDRLHGSSDKKDKATAKLLEKKILTAYLHRDSDDDTDWQAFIDKHSSEGDNLGAYIQIQGDAIAFENRYGGYYNGLKDLKAKNYAAAYQDFESFRQLSADPNAALEYREDLNKFTDDMTKYRGNLPDDYRMTANDYAISSLLGTNLTNPGITSSASLTTLENFAKRQAQAAGTVGGTDLQSILNGINNTGLSAQNAISNLTLSGINATAIGRGNSDPRGSDSYGWGALSALNSTGDVTQLGSPASSIGTNSVARTLSLANQTGTSTAGLTSAYLRGSRGGN